jgi:hypothetical protein
MPVTKLPKKIEAAVLFARICGLRIGSSAARISYTPNAISRTIPRASGTIVRQLLHGYSIPP